MIAIADENADDALIRGACKVVDDWKQLETCENSSIVRILY